MNINKALKLKIGDTVFCPADRGDKAFEGKVTFVSKEINKSYQGAEYIWVNVSNGKRSAGVWPSNRLA